MSKIIDREAIENGTFEASFIAQLAADKLIKKIATSQAVVTECNPSEPVRMVKNKKPLSLFRW